MSSLTDVCEQMAAALQTIDGLRASAHLKDQVNPLEAMISYSWDEQLTMDGGAFAFQFLISVYGQRVDARSTQQKFNLLADPTSATGIKRVVEGYGPLNALINYAHVHAADPLEVALVGNIDYLRLTFQVEVVL